MVVTATAQDVIDRAPLGALIRFSDGTPQPPARFKRKLKDWENRNGTGRLIENNPPATGRPRCSRSTWAISATKGRS